MSAGGSEGSDEYVIVTDPARPDLQLNLSPALHPGFEGKVNSRLDPKRIHEVHRAWQQGISVASEDQVAAAEVDAAKDGRIRGGAAHANVGGPSDAEHAVRNAELVRGLDREIEIQVSSAAL